MGAKIALSKPNDPNDFIVQELSKISALIQRGQPVTLFNEKDIQTMFGFFDITGKGTINQQQYLRGIANIPKYLDNIFIFSSYSVKCLWY